MIIFMKRKRLFVNKKTSTRQRIEIVNWAAANGYEAVVFPVSEEINEKSEYIKLAKKYELFIEAGGCELSLLLPRKLFFFHRDLFRMEQGKRKLHRHFCPTNPGTTAIIAENARQLFERSMKTVTIPRVFHLLPDEGYENIWCSCPACRAFTPAEQNIIAVNSTADILLKLDPNARLGFMDLETDPQASQNRASVAPRLNMFTLN